MNLHQPVAVIFISLIVIATLATSATAQTLGYRGVITTTELGSEIPIVAVDPNSPAEQMGLKPGDVILKINGITPLTQQQVKEALAARGGEVVLDVRRSLRGFVPNQPGNWPPPGGPPSGPPVGPGGLAPGGIFGIRAEGHRVANSNQSYLRVTEVVPGSLAESNGIRVGDVIWRLDGRALTSFENFKSAWAQSGNRVELDVQSGNNGPRRPIYVNR